MQPRRIDLHLHTDRSDGQHPSAEVLARCARGGLDLIAITDHDLPSDLAAGEHVVDGRTIRLLGAAEVSGVHAGGELHLLVYFPAAVPASFAAFCADNVRARALRYDEARSRLGLGGVPAADEPAHRGEHALTRHHLARALVAAGHAANLRDAFTRLVGSRSGTVPPVNVAFVDAIRIARDAGGITSWAHPPLELLGFLPAFARAGLHAVEALRPGLNSRDRRRTRGEARASGMFVTGGSDWHGWHDAEPGLFAVEPAEIQPFLDALAA
jgi:predicted metal-dependent phosphoesterase TrpH